MSTYSEAQATAGSIFLAFGSYTSSLPKSVEPCGRRTAEKKHLFADGCARRIANSCIVHEDQSSPAASAWVLCPLARSKPMRVDLSKTEWTSRGFSLDTLGSISLVTTTNRPKSVTCRPAWRRFFRRSRQHDPSVRLPEPHPRHRWLPVTTPTRGHTTAGIAPKPLPALEGYRCDQAV